MEQIRTLSLLAKSKRTENMTKSRSFIPDMLPTSPISLLCPFCKAKPSRDCSTTSSGFSVIHLARIKAAALIDNTRETRLGSQSDRAKSRMRYPTVRNKPLLIFKFPSASFGLTCNAIHIRQF
jgi:hypothetical protein